jgi:hypothetical protein
MLPIVFEAEDGTNVRDNAHQSLIIRSPEFIVGGGELSVSMTFAMAPSRVSSRKSAFRLFWSNPWHA